MIKDQYIISEIYNNILIERQINEQLDRELYNLINEDFEELQTLAKDAAGGFVQGIAKLGNSTKTAVVDTTAAVVDLPRKLANLPEKLSAYANSDLPTYLNAFGTFIVKVIASGAGGALVTNIVGRLLMNFAKKMNKSANVSEKLLYSMLPDEVKRRVAHLQNLPEKERLDKTIEANFKALEALQNAFKSKNLNTESTTFHKVIDYIGRIMNSVPGSLVGGLAISYICHRYFGFNPAPIFPKFVIEQ